jgi:RimJ/RimL family protein N-acetyltransferase
MVDFRNAFQSQRLVYRAVEDNDEDKNFVQDMIRSDPGIMALQTADLLRPATKDGTEAQMSWFKDCLLAVMICIPEEDAQEDRNPQHKPKLTPIGYACLVASNSTIRYRFHHRTAELAISIATPFHGKGYGQETINWLLDWAFRRANLHTVSLMCVDYNVAARKTYEKVGFVLTGRMRECDYADREWHDVLIYSMLESEWEILRGITRKA